MKKNKNINKIKNCHIVINTSFDRELYNVVALINSIKDFANPNNIYNIYVVSYDKTKNYIQDIVQSLETKNVKVNFILDFYEKYPNLPIINRKLLPIFFPNILKDCQKILFLSPNTLVQSDVAELLNENFSKKSIICSYDGYDKFIRKNEMNTLFNTDVMCVDVKLWNKLRLTDVCLSCINESNTEFNLNSLFNKVLYNNIQELSPEWNLQYWNTKIGFDEDEILNEKDIKIINFVDEKPWIKPMMNRANLWWKYVRNTPAYELIMYRNIYCNLYQANSKIIEPVDTSVVAEKANLDYVYLEQLQNEADTHLIHAGKDSVLLEKVINNNNICGLMLKYVGLSFKYIIFRSKRDIVKEQMDKIYNEILKNLSKSTIE